MPDAADRGSMDRGSLLAVLCNLGGLVGAFYLRSNIVLGGIGITQLAWLAPLWYYHRRKGKSEDAKGILIVAGITFLLNSACWALMGNARTNGISG